MGKVAGRMFNLKELEELCTKFLKYRIDSKNLAHFLKNTTKYDTPDLKEVVISRFVKDASNGFESDQVLELSEQELLSIMERKPEVQAKKVMDVLIRWARKMYKAEKKIESGEAKEGEEKKEDGEKTDSEDKSADKVEEEEEDFIEPLQFLVKYITWDHNDADYYLNKVHTKKILSETNKNNAMAQMLQAFVDSPSSGGPSSPAVKMGPKSATQNQQRATPANRNQRGGATKRPGGECDVVMERISKNPRAASANSRVKTEDEMIL